MAHAEVLVLHHTTTDGGARGTRPDRSWPASWLPDVLAGEPEEATTDDGDHRYRGARVLYSAGCRWIDVAGSPADPTTVRLTVVWGEAAPSAEDREAFLSWWTAASARAGWEPADSDDLVGEVVVVRYVPTDRLLEDVEPPVVLHDWDVPTRSHGDTSRTSGRRT